MGNAQTPVKPGKKLIAAKKLEKKQTLMTRF